MFNSLLNPQVFLTSGLDLSYGSLVNDKTLTSFLQNSYSTPAAQRSFNVFSYYEESFFYLMKRIYWFNTLNSVNNSFGFLPLQASVNTAQTETFNFIQAIPYSDTLVDNPFKVDLLQTTQNLEKTYERKISLNVTKDVFMSFWDNDLFTNEDEYLLTEFTASPNSKKSSLPFFLQYDNLALNQQQTPHWALTPLSATSRGINEGNGSEIYRDYLARSYTHDLVL